LKKILVTGSNGFIGSSLLKKIVSPEYEVHELNIEDGDIANPESLKIFFNMDIFHVIHLAGRIYVPDSWDDPHQFYSTNVMGTLNVLEFCRSNNCALTHVSAYLYGQPDKLPISEESKINPDNPYAHSKYLSEKLCAFYHNIFQTRIIILRPFNVFGIGQNNMFLIPSIIHQILNDDAITVNDLTPRRDYVYLEDLIQAIMRTLSCKVNFGIYNIGSGYSISVKEIIDKIQATFQSNKKVISKNVKRRGEISDVVANITHSEKELGWKPQHSFEEGVKQIYNEIQKNN